MRAKDRETLAVAGGILIIAVEAALLVGVVWIVCHFAVKYW